MISSEIRKKLTYGAPFLLTILMTLWIFHVPPAEPEHAPVINEFSLTIPQGYSIMPLELQNSVALGNLITQNGVVNVFEGGRKIPLIENLRIVKLSPGEGILFGALIPDSLVGRVQDRLSQKRLKGVLRPLNPGPTQIHIKSPENKMIQEMTVEDNS